MDMRYTIAWNHGRARSKFFLNKVEVVAGGTRLYHEWSRPLPSHCWESYLVRSWVIAFIPTMILCPVYISPSNETMFSSQSCFLPKLAHLCILIILYLVNTAYSADQLWTNNTLKWANVIIVGVHNLKLYIFDRPLYIEQSDTSFVSKKHIIINRFGLDVVNCKWSLCIGDVCLYKRYTFNFLCQDF